MTAPDIPPEFPQNPTEPGLPDVPTETGDPIAPDAPQDTINERRAADAARRFPCRAAG